MGCYNQYKTKRLLIHRVQKSAHVTLWHFGDWSLIKGRGDTKLEVGGQVKFYPYKRGGERKKV